MTTFVIFLLILMAIGNILIIGKERPPMTSGMASMNVLFIGLLIYLLIK